MDKISIITVTYNATATLEETIQSVIGQTWSDIEFIIIDGKSTDGTIDLIQKYESRIAFWKSEKDNGIYDAMNKGIAAATGEWLLFLGADDIFENAGIIEKIFSKYDTAAIDFLYGDVRIKSTGKIAGGSRTYEELIDKHVGSHQSIFYKRTVFEKSGVYDLRYKVLADYNMNLKIFRNSFLKTKYVPEVIAVFNDQGGASNVSIDKNFFNDQLNYFLTVEKRKKSDPLLQQYFFYGGFANIFTGRVTKGMAQCLRAFTSGRRKIYFMAVFLKYFAGRMGIGKKIKIV